MSLDVIEDLVALYKGATPPDVTASELGLDVAYTVATVLGMAEAEVSRLGAGISLSTATGLFLDQHGKDRGLRRQDGETDDQYRARLRTPPLAGTVSAILESLEKIVGPGVIIVELPRHSAYCDRAYSGVVGSPYVENPDLRSFVDRGRRMGGGRGVVIALIPASANAVASVTDALRSKVSSGKIWLVQEYVS